MAKKKSTRKVNTRRKNTKLSITNMIMISVMFTLVIGIIFAIIQFTGEQAGILPVINLDQLDWGMDGDSIIIFIIGFMGSIFIGSILVLYFIRKRVNLKK